MSTQLYTVTLDDLGTYQATVAADTEHEAATIAKTVLFDEVTNTVPVGVTITKQDTGAVATVAAEQPQAVHCSGQ